MSMLNDMMAAGGAPVLADSLGEGEDAVYHPPNGAADVRYPQPIVDPESQGEQLSDTWGGLGSVGGETVALQQLTVRVIPRRSRTEIVESGEFTVLGRRWAIEQIVSATDTLIELRLKRELVKRHPEARRR